MTNNLTRQQIVTYGKSHGYSPKEINKVLDQAKSNLVDYGINAGYKGSEINKVLNTAGYTNYNPFTAKANWENLLPNIAKGAKEFARDMKTMGGVVVQPFVDVQTAKPGDKLAKAKESFMNAINNDALRRTALGAGAGAAIGSKVGPIGLAGGAITGGLVGLLGVKGLTNSLLQPYDTSTKDIGQAFEGKKSFGDLATDIVQGGMRNPFYSGIDLLSAGGAKALGSAGRAIGRAVPNDAPMFVQQLLQTPGARDFNRGLTNSLQFSRTKNADLVEPLELLDSTPGINNENIVQFLKQNKGELSPKELEVGKALKTSLKKGEQKAIEYGFLDKNKGKNNVVAGYAMAELRDKIPNVLHDNLVEYIETGKMPNRIEKAVFENPELKTILDNTIKEGKSLYDKGDIVDLTQALTGTVDPLGEVVAGTIAKRGHGYFGTDRIIGRATNKDLAEVLEDSLAYQQKQITKATEAIDVIEDILKQPGVGKLMGDIKEVPKGSVVISPKALRQNIAKEYQLGGDINVSRALKDSGIAEAGAYLIPNVYLKALDNMFKPIGKLEGNKMLNAFKKTVLASPHWFFLNRIGNLTNNSMGGVKLTDYVDAVKYGDIMPTQLKQQTSFGSFVGDKGGTIKDGIIKPLKMISKDLRKAYKSDKSVGDGINAIESVIANTSDLFSNPVFRAEASAETTDRLANFIRQAKREGEATKTDWKEIVKKAETDNGLFNKLNTQVNKDLGDYVGRNYIMDNRYYEALRATVPFYRFLTQTGRTSFHQLANHPIAFQSTVVAPAKAGKQFSEDIMQKYGLDPDTYEGGVPYATQDDGTTRFIGVEPLPAGAVASDLLSSGNKLNLISPMYTLGGNIASYKKSGGWLPTSEGLTQYKLQHGTTKGYEPTAGERWGYGASQLANTFYAPVRTGRGWMRELGNFAIGKPTLSNYDANIFQVNPLSYSKELPIETLGKWFGVQNMPYYPKYVQRPKKPTKREMAKAKMYREQYNRNTKKGK